MEINPFTEIIKSDVVLTFKVVRGVKKVWIDTSCQNLCDLDYDEKLALLKAILKYADNLRRELLNGNR